MKDLGKLVVVILALWYVLPGGIISSLVPDYKYPGFEVHDTGEIIKSTCYLSSGKRPSIHCNTIVQFSREELIIFKLTREIPVGTWWRPALNGMHYGIADSNYQLQSTYYIDNQIRVVKSWQV